LAWIEDVDSAKGMQDEEVLIAGKHEVRLSGDGESQELVIFGIAARGCGCNAINEGCLPAQVMEKTEAGL